MLMVPSVFSWTEKDMDHRDSLDRLAVMDRVDGPVLGTWLRHTGWKVSCWGAVENVRSCLTSDIPWSF